MSSDRGRRRVLPRVGRSFPCGAFLPLVGAAVDEAQNNIKAPKPLIFFSALAAIAVAAQGQFDVLKPNGQRVPTSLMLLSIADSGERKSTTENIFFEAIREVQSEFGSMCGKRILEWESDFSIWEVKNRALLKRIEGASSKGECTEEYERRYADSSKRKPVKPGKFKILYEDSTSEALLLGLSQNLSTAGLVSSEGGGILNGRALNDLPKQNAIWSGDSVTVDRKSAESYEVSGARLTVSIMAQDGTFRDYLRRIGGKSRGSGLWARFLVCRPESTQGTRFIENGTMSWEYRYDFSRRLKDVVKGNIFLLDGSGVERKVVKFSPEASVRWLDVFNAIEEEIVDGGRFDGAGDHASKLAENISRVAALLHVFEGFDGDISLRTLDFAIDFCLWCSDEFVSIFSPPRQEYLDAFELDEWLSRIRDDDLREVRKNYVRQYCPNKLRVDDRLNKALSELCDQGKIAFFRRGRTQWVDLFPNGGGRDIFRSVILSCV